MAKVVLLVRRDGGDADVRRCSLQRLVPRLTPDNLADPPLRWVSDDHGLCIAVFCANGAVGTVGNSVCQGMLEDGTDGWWHVGSAAPEGSYALYRADADFVELVTDAVGSRTIWYLKTDEVFVASSSQRAIAFLTGAFEPNPATRLWMLSAGTLGPELAWDRRVQTLPPQATLRLDRQNWTTSLRADKIRFDPETGTDAQFEQRLLDAIETTVERLSFDRRQWMFPLSGGVDCRTILSLLKDREGLTCMTWGIQPSLTDPSNDAYLARQIADHFHLPHRFFAADSVEEDFANVLDRFLIAGEGRVDHLTGYQDGFRLWRELYESGIQGVIRGDQGFCPKPISNEVEARHSVHLAMLDDFPELNAFSEAVQGYLGSQMFPENLQRTSDETLEAWRDRVRHTYGLGAVQGALNDLKATYVELANPLLSPRIIAVVRGLPDHLRRRKHVLRQIARRVGPPVPFARALATRDMGDFVASPAAAAVLAQELESPLMRELISDAAVDFLSEGLRDRPGPGQSQLRRAGRRIKGWLPTALKRKLRRAVGCQPPSRYVLALRACLISRMHQMLSEDARAGRNTTE